MADQWYGALYYEIVPAKVKRRNHYLLLGWDGGDLFVNRKVIDVLSFSSSGVPRFGKSVFKFKKDRKKRVVFEFSYMATMRLFYDDDIDMVVFEHMTPIKPLDGYEVKKYNLKRWLALYIPVFILYIIIMFSTIL